MKIKVLWIDDEYQKQEDVIGSAEQYDIDIIAFESSEEGIMELNNNLSSYQAVILDAKVKNKMTDTTTGLEGLQSSRDELVRINERTYLPHFIFTGQPGYMDNEVFRESYGKFYIKGKDNEQLFIDLIDQVQNKEEYQLKREYKSVFEVFDNRYLGEGNDERMLEILKQVKDPKLSDTKDLFTPLRKIIEALFASLNQKGFIPDEIFNATGWINGSSKFLAGKYDNYDYDKETFPLIITKMMWSCLNVIQDASHAEGGLRLNVDEYVQKQKTPYLYQSIVFQLLDILVWYKGFIDSGEKPSWKKKEIESTTDQGRKNNEIDSPKGIIKEDENGNFYCNDHALNKLYVQDKDHLGKRIKMLDSKPNGNFSTKHLYPKYCGKYDLI